jgi:hypothetical protein
MPTISGTFVPASTRRPRIASDTLSWKRGSRRRTCGAQVPRWASRAGPSRRLPASPPASPMGPRSRTSASGASSSRSAGSSGSASASCACASRARPRASRSPSRELGRCAEPATRRAVVAAVKAAGFRRVVLDLEGFRSGSLNEGLEKG